MLGMRTPTAAPLLLLLLPLLAATARLNYVAVLNKVADDPKVGDKKATAATQKLQQIRDALDKLQADIAGAGSALDAKALRGSISSMMNAVCDCDSELPEDLSLHTAQQILAGVDARIQAAEQALSSGSDLPSAQVIEKKSVLHGVLLQVPPVRNSFSDTAAQLKEGITPKGLIDPVDSRKKEFTSHFLSEQMSVIASLAGVTLGSSSAKLFPGLGSVVSMASRTLGPVGSALSLLGLMQASVDMERRRSQMVKEEVDLHVVWEPRGAVAIDFDDLELVEPALRFLDGIVQEEDEEERRSRIVRFLRRYGSHVCHKVTLGGTRQTRSILRTHTSISSAEARFALKMAAKKDQTKEAVGASGDKNDSLHADPLDLGHSSSNGNLVDMVTIEKEVNGGASDLPQGLWTHSLVNNENWQIIDRHIQDCTPIWEFVHRDRKRFGRKLEKEMFATWYMNFLHLKEFSREHGVELPGDLTTEEQLLDWISSHYENLMPKLDSYRKCDLHGWCGGHGDCGPETEGVCVCHNGYQLQEGTCVVKHYPLFGGGGVGCLGWLFPGHAEAVPATRSSTDEEEPEAMLEAGSSGGVEWDDSFFYPWLEMVAGEDSSLRGAGLAYFEEAMELVIDDAETEAELIQVAEKTIRGQAALIKIFDNPDYVRQLAQDAEDLAVILKLDGAESYLEKLLPSAGSHTAGLKSLQDIAASEVARQSLAVKLSLFSQQLADPEFASSARSMLQLKTASLGKIIQELKSSRSRREIVKLLASRAHRLLAKLPHGGEGGTADESTCIPCKLKDVLVRHALPLQGQASSDLVSGLEELQGGTANKGSATK